MTQFLKNRPLWFWAIVGLALLLFLDQVSGYRQSSKLYNMALDGLRQDQSKVIETLEESLSQREQELSELYNQIGTLQKRVSVVRAENEKLRGKIDELQRQRETVVISDDPDSIVDDLHKLGFRSAHRRKGPTVPR